MKEYEYKKLNDDVNLPLIKLKYNNSLGLVFFPAFDWKISRNTSLNDKSVYFIRVDQIVEEGLLDIPNIREYNPIVADWDTIERGSRWCSRFRVLGD